MDLTDELVWIDSFSRLETPIHRRQLGASTFWTAPPELIRLAPTMPRYSAPARPLEPRFPSGQNDNNLSGPATGMYLKTSAGGVLLWLRLRAMTTDNQGRTPYDPHSDQTVSIRDASDMGSRCARDHGHQHSGR